MDQSINELPKHRTPGRWVGGLAGLVACVVTGLAAGVVGTGFVSSSGLVPLVMGGLPIAFLGGRALLPAARSGGWLEAFAVGLVFGMIAPPLGAIEIILVGLLSFPDGTTGLDAGYVVLLPVVLLFSYVVAFLTVPAGLIWALIVRAIPDHVLEATDLGQCLGFTRLSVSTFWLRRRRLRLPGGSRDSESRFVGYDGRNSP